MQPSTLRQLPRLKNSGEPRVYALCEDYLTNVDGRYDASSFERYVLSYEQVSVLKTVECWVLPIAMRVVLIHRLAQAMAEVRYRHEVCGRVSSLVDRVHQTDKKESNVRTLLEAEAGERELTPVEIVHVVRHLNELNPDIRSLHDWLGVHIANSETSLEHMVSYEHQLQARLQVTCGNLVQSLHVLERFPWRLTFEKISYVVLTLSAEGNTQYDKLDVSSQDVLCNKTAEIADKLNIPETVVAKTAVRLAEEHAKVDNGNASNTNGSGAKADNGNASGTNASSQSRFGTLPRQATLAYYLLDAQGTTELRRALCKIARPRRLPVLAIRRRPLGTYLMTGLVLFIALLVVACTWIVAGRTHRIWSIVAVVAALLLPVSEWAVTMLHAAIARCCRPKTLLRYDFSKQLPDSARTMVVMPIIWSSIAEVDDVMDRLLVHYFANRQENIHFAVLADLSDANDESLPIDDKLIRYAKKRIEALQSEYEKDRFFLFHRRRKYNPVDRVYMGWERKRGKLVEFIELLNGSTDTSFTTVCGEQSVLPKVRYVLTVDHDTKLPMGAVSRLAATMHHPYNRPRLNKQGTRVIEGYGVLQPRITMSFDSSTKSRFAALWAGAAGIDPYAFAVSSPYQDLFDKATFVGKGIFDVDVFHKVLSSRIPDNQVLSHDTLEGGFLRTGFTSDIEIVEDHPSTLYAHQVRAHRWTRGDWQLIKWLGRTCKDRHGDNQPIDLCGLTRWQIIDNLRRSLLSPAIFALILLGLWLLPGRSWVSGLIGFLTLFLPTLRAIYGLVRGIGTVRALWLSMLQSGYRVLALPYSAAVSLDAVVRTLYRMLISKKRLLEWVPAATTNGRLSRKRLFNNEALGLTLVALFATLAWVSGTGSGRWFAALAILIWGIASRLVVGMLNQERRPSLQWLASARPELQRWAKDTWTFYEHYVTEEESWLPPDNVQFHPQETIAHRTSPTNIGLYLVSVVAAFDLGLIASVKMVERLRHSLRTLMNMDKWNGHLFNWYDTRSAKPLAPRYVSTVDSGNLIAYLMVVRQSLKDMQLLEEMESLEEMQSLEDMQSLKAPPERQSVDAAKDSQGSRDGEQPMDGIHPVVADLAALIDDIDTLIENTDFRALFSPNERVFCLGYHFDADRRETVLYDLLASEARQASFVAIALGQIPVSHWFALGRTMTIAGRHKTLLSWSGTMFEYLMPSLIMKTYRNTVWDSTYRGVIDRQRAYGASHQVPFGISESGYYAFDYQMNYQYRAFGVPGLGFDRGLERHLVIAPYATTMALPFAGPFALKALHQLEVLGAKGPFGFYEAVDFTSHRLPPGSRYKVIESFMAHHQGMSMLTLTNLLTDNVFVRRFHADARVKAAELLLQERIPEKVALIEEPIGLHARVPDFSKQVDDALRRFEGKTGMVSLNVLSNGRLASVLTNRGTGFLSWNQMMVTRWRDDAVEDTFGAILYLHDVESEETWSVTSFPNHTAKDLIGVFQLDRTVFEGSHSGISAKLEVTISGESDAEVRRLSITNQSREERTIEVTSFLELCLANQASDIAHPAFSKLFVQTSHDDRVACLLAKRRSQDDKEDETWAVHKLYVQGQEIGDYEYETDRAQFIGRGGTLSAPKALAGHLRGSVGSVADPAFVMRRTVRLREGASASVYMVTGVANSRDEGIDLIESLNDPAQADRAFHLAWVRAQIDLRHLHLTPKDVVVANELAARLLYTPPLSKQRRQAILQNTLGQSSLWSLSLSGDVPICTVSIDNLADLPFIVGLAKQHQYLCQLGLDLDLVVLDKTEGGYQDELMNRLRDELAARGIYAPKRIISLKYEQITFEERTLLAAVSRVWVRAGGPSLHAQLQIEDDFDLRVLSVSPIVDSTGISAVTADVNPAVNPAVNSKAFRSGSSAADSSNLEFFNGFGGFAENGKNYKIYVKPGHELPRPWTNVLANPQFGTILTELGTGYTWWRNSREFKLTPWTNDPVIDRPGECLYIRDLATNEVWSGGPKPAGAERNYTVTHGFGFTRFEQNDGEVSHVMETVVPVDHPLKLIRLTLHNHSKVKKRIAVTYYAEWVLGVIRETEASHIVTTWDERSETLLAHNTYQETFREAVAFLHLDASAWQASHHDSAHLPEHRTVSWTGDRSDFIGQGGTIDRPAGVMDDGLSCHTGAFSNTCGAVQRLVELSPNEEQTVLILFGCTQSAEEAVDLVSRYSRAPSMAKPEHGYDGVREGVARHWAKVTGQVQVETPDRAMDILLNGWLLYQALACRLWARTAFYQAGGAFGFRDQLQDALAFLHADETILRQQILRSAKHQYREGDVQHWWHEETNKGIRTRFSDDLLWLPYAVSRYLEQTGELGILDERVAFLTSAPLKTDELERYENTVVSDEQGTVLEHCLRAIRHACKFGEHGIPLMGIGDWNDGMNRVGSKGRGESVWLGWFLLDILNRFARIKVLQKEVVQEFAQTAQRLQTAINDAAWDGAWFRRAFTDDGTWLGSIADRECRIDAIAQSWSVISQRTTADREERAMRSFDRELVDRDLGIAKLLTRAFDETKPSPGYIQGYPPGIRENGGQYTHGVIWSIVAWAMLGRHDKAHELFAMLNPISHTQSLKEVLTFGNEPYVMTADVYTAVPLEGRGGWSWYTGAAGWMYQAGLEYVLGVKRREDKLYVAPCVPLTWREFRVTYRYRSATYVIEVQLDAGEKSNHAESEGTASWVEGTTSWVEGTTTWVVDGKTVESNHLLLADDGQEHIVTVYATPGRLSTVG
ncbi:GH36-type glycosyl hydrolase domain-containing protein [Alicyclobacillus mengziensis]|uniref:Carbohydrate-binding protein n=1 Tax=Alicyclobacillus mengziensis TaxID=2931921 RepID=A0A9X7Z8B9_9BACL|nr:glucoamylase family protein [Alicyclobacillus mengziensis]QSO48108.1 carbohydrate-binding protein [Alicyclobacillus mengziensis]